MTAALVVLALLVLAVAVVRWVRPRPWDPQLRKPHDWKDNE